MAGEILFTILGFAALFVAIAINVVAAKCVANQRIDKLKREQQEYKTRIDKVIHGHNST